MKRLLAALTVTPLALLALGGPAAAARPDRILDSATFAHAGWEYESEDMYVEGGLSAVHSRTGPLLVFEQSTFLEGGAWTATRVAEPENAPFTLTIDRGRLTTANLRADDVTLEVCAYTSPQDEDPDCMESSVDINLTWTARGPIIRSVENSRYADGTERINTHGLSFQRDATVAGSVTGAVAVDDFSEAWMQRSRYLEIRRPVNR